VPALREAALLAAAIAAVDDYVSPVFLLSVVPAIDDWFVGDGLLRGSRLVREVDLVFIAPP
jgi:hypothetical protein